MKKCKCCNFNKPFIASVVVDVCTACFIVMWNKSEDGCLAVYTKEAYCEGERIKM